MTPTPTWPPTARRRSDRARTVLPAALAAVLVADLVGGLLDVRAGRSTLRRAWSSDATLCAPWPMMAAQTLAVVVAVRSTGRSGRVAAGALALACGVSLASGFFDGQLARGDLSGAARGYQGLLLALTGALGGLAVPIALGVRD